MVLPTPCWHAAAREDTAGHPGPKEQFSSGPAGRKSPEISRARRLPPNALTAGSERAKQGATYDDPIVKRHRPIELEIPAVTAEPCRRTARMKVCLTVDVEQDCPPFWSTFRGIEEGLPKLLALLAARRIDCTFFTTGDVGRRYPGPIGELTARGHELGCHGDTHRRFDACNLEEARAEIQAATATLRRFGPVVSFRARTCAFPSVLCRCWKPKITAWTLRKPDTNRRAGWARPGHRRWCGFRPR